ncbi:Nucleoside-diphosphate-sugar pyrophosphorylase family protein [Idiomarina sp. A28L]|uniref:N-acetylmuramate alpha-1-phosphate uridylyltransferase MurU n=1 Tax=Idiomarina sp. A28L TaxID=1036674 RepID=UPI00021386FE|nr:nucleotidyltransferase family protein [Idiomarina sp. A28L]EGN75265.1 Nucleoside-diphosphate-sugar pyrophosphorylase family protein [Idiomarina sp. A28L]
MRAMILAAGRGERMRPLTDHTPKPLLKVAGKPLIVWHLENLKRAGIEQVVINTAWLPEQFEQALGDGSNYGVQITYSKEPEGGLETAGGVINALPHLGDEPFVLVNGDIWCDFDFRNLPKSITELGHLVMVDNPEHHPSGDFSIRDSFIKSTPALTFSGISILHPKLFAGAEVGFLKLRPFFEQAINKHSLTGEHYQGFWTDVGTPERLAQLSSFLASDNSE